MKSKLNKFILIGLIAFACENEPTKYPLKLPVYGDKKVGSSQQDTIYHTVKDYQLINQYGELINKEDTKNRIFVANFFFATCQSICPEMSTNLTEVQNAFLEDDSLLIISHSVNPLHDTVEVLQNYAAMYGAKKGKWHLLTGDKAIIYSVAKNDYLVNAVEDDGTPEGFLHSELFLLIDTKRRIRGLYDGTDKAQVQKLISDIKLLKTEKES